MLIIEEAIALSFGLTNICSICSISKQQIFNKGILCVICAILVLQHGNIMSIIIPVPRKGALHFGDAVGKHSSILS